MGRYAEQGRCLDCQTVLGTAAVCTDCGLVQVGPEAARLRDLLTAADLALAAVGRSVVMPALPEPTAMSQPAAAPAGYVPPPAGWQPPPYPRPPEPALPRRQWPAFSTPAVLLGLGALCVLVAAVVFVSVAWSDLSLGAKAAIMLAVTGTVAGLGGWALRRGLRRSAEAFSVLSVVLVGLDFGAARDGGLIAGGLSDTGASWVVAGLTVSVGLAWALAAQRTDSENLVGAQVLAAVGATGLAMLTLDEQFARNEYVALLLAGVAAASAAGSWLRRLRALGIGVGALAGLLYTIAAAASLEVVVVHSTWRGLWSTGEAVGWVLCAAVPAAVAWWPTIPRLARRVAAAATVTALTVLVLRPLEGSSYDQAVIVLVAVSAVAAVGLVVPDPWAWGARIGAIPALGLALLSMGPSALQALARATAPLIQPWAYQPSDLVDADLGLDQIGTPWVVGLAAVVAVAVVHVVVARRLPSPEHGLVAGVVVATLTALVYPLYAGWAVVALLVGAAACAAGWLARRSELPAAATAALSVLALSASAASELTTALTALLFAVVAAAGSLALHHRAATSAAAATSLLFAGLSLAAASQFTDFGDEGLALVFAGVAAAAVVGAQTRLGGSALRQREGLEGGGVALAVAGLWLARHSEVSLPIAMTVVGAALVGVALLREDRRPLSAAGGLLLAGATWVRLYAEGVDAVEAYTLPTALVLTALGWRRLQRLPDSSSVTNLAPGLVLALVPSLLATLPDPTSLRALLLGIGALVVLLVGASRWLAGPLLIGGGVLAVLAVVNLAPYAAAIPRWVLFAAVGAGLLFLGVTWERRLREARNLTIAIESLR